jgi:predicted transcriptional regulator
MSSDMAETLDRLANETDTNQAEVLRRALSLYARVKRDADDHVILETVKNNKVTKKIEIEV